MHAMASILWPEKQINWGPNFLGGEDATGSEMSGMQHAQGPHGQQDDTSGPVMQDLVAEQARFEQDKLSLEQRHSVLHTALHELSCKVVRPYTPWAPNAPNSRT